MKYRLLNFLMCPDCGGELTLSVFKESKASDAPVKKPERCEQTCAFKGQNGGGSGRVADCTACYSHEVEAGLLSCTCKSVYPVAAGIPRMLPGALGDLGEFVNDYRECMSLEGLGLRVNGAALRQSSYLQRKTRESFGYQWLRYDVNDEKEDCEVFLSDSQLSEQSVQDRIVLDAGCGMGRYTAVAAGMGAEVIGLDLSPSVLKAYDKAGKNPRMHIVQGDILHLPLREKQFDVIYSLGVLHHTPDPRQAFMNLVKCLKAEGIISVWLYGTAGRFTDFKTNPWKKGRRRYLQSNIAQRAHWLMVLLRENIYHALRALTTRIHLPLLYLLCYPLAALGKVPLIKYLTASVHRNWRVRLQENFDWFSPQYQSHHSKEEVRGWFDAARVEVISQLEHGFIPKVGFKGRVRKRHEANTQGLLR